ncbi:MAG: hypothetical protein AAFU73_03560 [Planctomycetota bacterium]
MRLALAPAVLALTSVCAAQVTVVDQTRSAVVALELNNFGQFFGGGDSVDAPDDGPFSATAFASRTVPGIGTSSGTAIAQSVLDPLQFDFSPSLELDFHAEGASLTQVLALARVLNSVTFDVDQTTLVEIDGILDVPSPLENQDSTVVRIYLFPAALGAITGFSYEVPPASGSTVLDSQLVLQPGRYGLFFELNRSTGISIVAAGPPRSLNLVDDVSLTFRFTRLVEPYCDAVPGVSGLPAVLFPTGRPSLSQGNVVLRVRNAAPANFGLFFYGSAPQQVPLGIGDLCVGGSIVRLGAPVLTDTSGSASRAVDPLNPGVSQSANPIATGSTFYFQFWFRDPLPGGPGFNTSSALAVSYVD